MKDAVKNTFMKPGIYTMAFICLCFLLTSTAFLGWSYNVMSMVSPKTADAISLSAGYLMQAAGIGLFLIFLRRRPDLVRRSIVPVLIIHLFCLFPAARSGLLVAVLISGLLMNLACGWIAGYYLYILTAGVPAGNCAVTLGIGYGFSILFSWLLSLPVNYSDSILVICLVLSAAVFLTDRKILAVSGMTTGKDDGTSSKKLPKNLPLKTLLILAGSLVLVFSIVNSCGFGFPSSDLKVGISLEFSRLFYAAGLIIAGFANDRNRRDGAVCALAALVIPFIMLALKGEPVSQMIFWILSYFVFGFYTVFRIILFSDIARKTDLLWLSGFGLMIGRVGDAVGETVYILLSDHFPVFLVFPALLFIAAVVLFLRVYQLIYLPQNGAAMSEREKFNLFSANHDLSAREREVLRQILQEKSNSEIAQNLSVSESTVKFHVHNLLQKTGCRNRIALLSFYQTNQP